MRLQPISRSRGVMLMKPLTTLAMGCSSGVEEAAPGKRRQCHRIVEDGTLSRKAWSMSTAANGQPAAEASP